MNILPDRREMSSVFSLAAPITAMQLGMMAYGVVDTLFVGRLGAPSLAGVGLAHASYITIFLLGIGTLLGIDTLSSRAYGAGRKGACAAILLHALALALGIAVLLFAVLHSFGPFYRLMGVEPSVARSALGYLSIIKWMIFPGLLFVACRQYLQSMGATKPLLWAVVCGNLSNVALDYALIFGKFGFPALGVAGCAISSVATAGLAAAFVAAAALRKANADAFHFRGWRKRVFVNLLRLGIPAGLALLIEISLFSIVMTLMARFGAVPTAAHQIAMNLVSTTFMVPLSISFAAAVRVGQGLGREDPQGAVKSGNAALFLGGAFMACAGIILWIFPEALIRLYTPDAAVSAVGVPLLKIAALFQVFDGIQVVLIGSLRGLGETRIPLYANIVGHLALGLPVSYWLAFEAGKGPGGLWIGMLIGLTCVAFILFVVWKKRAAALGASPPDGARPSAQQRSPSGP